MKKTQKNKEKEEILKFAIKDPTFTSQRFIIKSEFDLDYLWKRVLYFLKR